MGVGVCVCVDVCGVWGVCGGVWRCGSVCVLCAQERGMCWASMVGAWMELCGHAACESEYVSLCRGVFIQRFNL